MRTPFMRHWLTAALGVLALGSAPARAEADRFGVGSGRNGPLTVSASGLIINAYVPVTAALARKATSIPAGACVGDPCFATGDLVLVYQATGLGAAPASGSSGPFDLTTDPVGRWELARLKSVTPGAGGAMTLELTAPLVQDYAASATQVIRVPEYTTVSIPVGKSLTARAWNGSTGGVVAFLAQNEVDNQGLITVEGLGFRGAQYVAGDVVSRGCSELDETAPRGSQKGEGIGGTALYGPTHTGRGNRANGGGGAVCFQSGGGGGGNGGAGGVGGRSDFASDGERAVGGLGGAALNLPLLTHLTFGGGGGAGHGTAAAGLAAGAGGGVIFFRASQLSGSGILRASGAPVNTYTEGGSGGGAGGSIYARIIRTAGCGSAIASGGIGSTTSGVRVGPGGGGGGGQVLFQSAGGACPLLATGAASGGQALPVAGAYGATEGQSSTPTAKTYGFILPAAPSVTTPAAGLITNNVRPRVTGKAQRYPETASPSTEVILYLDDVELGHVMSDDKGNYSFDLTQDLSESDHHVQAAIVVDAVQSPDSTSNTFTVDITPPRTVITGPDGAIRERNPKFEFSANEDPVTYTCSLDGAAFGPCPADGSFPELADGGHTLQVRAQDRAGNVGEPTQRTFRVTVADRAFLGEGVGCTSTGSGASLLLSLGALTLGLRRRRQGGAA